MSYIVVIILCYLIDENIKCYIGILSLGTKSNRIGYIYRLIDYALRP